MRLSISRTGLISFRKQLVRTITESSASTSVAQEQLKPWQEIPGPSSLPIIGQILHFLPGGELSDPSLFLDQMYKKYGPIVRLDAFFGRPIHIFVFDSEMCAQVLRGENWMPERPGFPSLTYYRKNYNKNKEQSLKPTGLITDQDENWKQFRSAVNPVMLQPKTIKLYSSAIIKVAQDMIEKIKNNRDEKGMLHGKFDEEINLWSLESIGVVALGRRLNCIDPKLPEDSPERKLLRCVHDFFGICDKLDFKPSLWRYYPTKTYKRAMNLYGDLENLTKYFIRKTMDNLQNNKLKSDEEKSILEKLLEINEETAVIMACDMLFAGVDTTATTVTGVLYFLAANPEKQDKLREELTTQESRTYIKACIKESLRIYPVVSGNLRKTTKEYNLLGYRIPKDMLVAFGHEVLSRDEQQYPRSQEFIPERWIEKNSPLYYKQAHPFAYSPFGFGVRSCIGRRIAELEIETFVEKVIRNFQLEWIGSPPGIKRTALNYFTGPFNFVFKDL